MLSFPLKWRVFSFFPALSRSIPHFSNTLSPYTLCGGGSYMGIFIAILVFAIAGAVLTLLVRKPGKA